MTNDQHQVNLPLRYLFLKIIIPLFFIFNFSFFLVPSPAYAQIQDMTINADKLTLEKDKNLIEASGSVEVTYQDLLIRG